MNSCSSPALNKQQDFENILATPKRITESLDKLKISTRTFL